MKELPYCHWEPDVRFELTLKFVRSYAAQHRQFPRPSDLVTEYSWPYPVAFKWMRRVRESGQVDDLLARLELRPKICRGGRSKERCSPELAAKIVALLQQRVHTSFDLRGH